MLDFELEELQQNSDWRAVLSSYQAAHHAAQAAAKTSDQEFDGWLPRIMSVEELDDESLPRIHGKLIAWGFLKFQLASRGTGVVYQISPSGREALANVEVSDRETDEIRDVLPMKAPTKPPNLVIWPLANRSRQQVAD